MKYLSDMRGLWLALTLVIVSMKGLAADVPVIAGSASPDGNLHAVMDVDRDPTIDPEWKGGSYPKIEITEKGTGKVVLAVEYSGSPGDDQRPLREHVSITWRKDSKAFGLTVNDRFYSNSVIYTKNAEGRFVMVTFPSYEEMTGFPTPNTDDLRPRGRDTVEGWNEEGLLIYYLFLGPLPTYQGKDPLEHRVLLEVSPTGMKKVRALKVHEAK